MKSRITFTEERQGQKDSSVNGKAAYISVLGVFGCFGLKLALFGSFGLSLRVLGRLRLLFFLVLCFRF
jgi:hypothetical protein